MVRFTTIFAAAFLSATPAFAGVTSLGSTAAKSCYEAAERPTRPIASDFARCDEALGQETLSAYDLAATRVNRGILYLRRGEIDRAMTDFDTAMAMRPEEPETYLNRGAAFLRREDDGQAIAMFTAALERNTRRPELAYFGRAVARESQGQVRAAYDDYRRALAAAPNWRDPQEELRRFRVARN